MVRHVPPQFVEIVQFDGHPPVILGVRSPAGCVPHLAEFDPVVGGAPDNPGSGACYRPRSPWPRHSCVTRWLTFTWMVGSFAVSSEGVPSGIRSPAWLCVLAVALAAG